MTQSIRFENQPDIVHASRTVVGDGMLPNRIVLRDLGEKFVTHRESLEVRVDHTADGDTVVFTHRSYETGHYFEVHGCTREQALDRAHKDFTERCERL